MGWDRVSPWDGRPHLDPPPHSRPEQTPLEKTKFSASLSRQGRALPRVRPRPSCCSPVSRNNSQGGPWAQGLDSLVETGQGRGDKSAAVIERNMEGDAENTTGQKQDFFLKDHVDPSLAAGCGGENKLAIRGLNQPLVSHSSWESPFPSSNLSLLLCKLGILTVLTIIQPW